MSEKDQTSSEGVQPSVTSQDTAAPSSSGRSAKARSVTAPQAAQIKLIDESGMFDAKWYLAIHPDAADSELQPELHFLTSGGQAGWPPSPRFDSADYLARYADVAKLGMNPLFHYLRYGKAEKRVMKPVDLNAFFARLISDSGFFDDDWYRASYPETVELDLTPASHFLMHGRDRGHSPGPSFDAADYLSRYKDIAAAKINPLVHYLLFGKAEGRVIRPMDVKTPPAGGKKPAAKPAATAKAMPAAVDVTADDIDLVASSPLFDAGWYASRYKDVTKSGIPAAEHYLRFGAAELRAPSVYFDPQYYMAEQCPGLHDTATNPLLHYLKTGKESGLVPRALFESVSPRREFKPQSPGDWPLVEPAGLASADQSAWRRHSQLQVMPGKNSLFLGHTMVAWSPVGDLAAQTSDRLIAFLRLSGLPDVGLLTMEGAESIAIDPFDGRGFRCFGGLLEDGPARIVDAWHASDRLLRLRLAGSDPSASPLAVTAFQWDEHHSQGVLLTGETLHRADETSFADVTLYNPLMPVLLVVSDINGSALDISLLPFPSLCRGGIHYAETVGSADISQPLQQLKRLSDRLVPDIMRTAPGSGLVARIDIDLNGATGAEPIFSEPLREWMAKVFSVAVVPREEAGQDDDGQAYLRMLLGGTAEPANATSSPSAGEPYVLDLPADAVPTLAVLAAESGRLADEVTLGHYYVAERATAQPQLSVVLPTGMDDLLSLQPDWAPRSFPVLRRMDGQPSQSSGGAKPADFHLAIRFPPDVETHPAALLMPLAPDSADSIVVGDQGAHDESIFDVVLRVSSPERAETAVGSLLTQRRAVLGHVRVVPTRAHVDMEALAAVLDRAVPGRWSQAGAGEEFGAPFTLFLDDDVVLHDPRTIGALSVLARHKNTASASCVLLRDIVGGKGAGLKFESGGYFASHVSLLSRPRLVLAAPDCRKAFANMTYPVVMNDPGCLLAHTAALPQELTNRLAADDPDFLGFSLAALSSGHRHLCTSAVRAASSGPLPHRKISDPPGLDVLGAQQWEIILANAANVRDLHG